MKQNLKFKKNIQSLVISKTFFYKKHVWSKNTTVAQPLTQYFVKCLNLLPILPILYQKLNYFTTRFYPLPFWKRNVKLNSLKSFKRTSWLGRTNSANNQEIVFEKNIVKLVTQSSVKKIKIVSLLTRIFRDKLLFKKFYIKKLKKKIERTLTTLKKAKICKN